MIRKNYISLNKLCDNYEVEMSFFTSLNEHGLIEIILIEKSQCIHQDRINDLEKMMRMYHELNINFEGIDAVFNLLGKVNDLQIELASLKNRLLLYEDEGDRFV